MTSPPLERSTLGIVAVSALTAIWLALSVLLDRAALLELISPFWVALLGIASILLLGVALRAPKHASAGCAMLAVLLAILSFVRSGPLKGFYMDCHGLQPGMALRDVVKTMSPYLLLESPLEREPALTGMRRAPWFSSDPSAEPDRITFISSLEDPADLCMVYAKAGSVSAVHVSPD